MKIQILLFATAREAVGTGRMDIEISNECDTEQLRALLAQQYPALASLVLDRQSITLALNEEYVGEGQILPLRDGDTVALIPPISGG